MNARFLTGLVVIGLLLPLGVEGAAQPAPTLAAESSPLCAADATWVDMDDSQRHLAALNRAILGAYDVNGDGQTCVQLVADERAANLRVVYQVVDLGEAKEAGATAEGCPVDSGLVDISKPERVPVPLTREHLTTYDRNGDAQVCVAAAARCNR